MSLDIVVFIEWDNKNIISQERSFLKMHEKAWIMYIMDKHIYFNQGLTPGLGLILGSGVCEEYDFIFAKSISAR